MDAILKQIPRVISRFGRWAAVAGLIGSTASCGADFDPPSKVNSLRVVAVQKDHPYAKPGELVTLKMLWTDGTPVVAADGSAPAAPARKINITWLAWCLNPPGDLYYGCFAQPGLTELFSIAFNDQYKNESLEGMWPGLGHKDTFTVRIPEEGAPIVSPALLAAAGAATGTGGTTGAGGMGSTDSPFAAEIPNFDLRQPPDPAQPPYGLAYVYFAACAGQLTFDAAAAKNAASSGAFQIPLRCLDDQGKALGADDFVVGYTPIFVYRDLTNANPVVTGFNFQGKDYPVKDSQGVAISPVTTCADQDCLPTRECKTTSSTCQGSAECCSGICGDDLTCAAPAEGNDLVPIVPHCAGESCPTYEYRPIVANNLAEPDPVAAVHGESLSEQMWITYLVQGGEVSKEVRLLNDPTKGYNNDFSAKFTAPPEPGWSQIWASVRDNRGGVGWVRQRIYVE